MLGFLVRTFSRIYLFIDRRRDRSSAVVAQPSDFGHDTNYPFF